MQTVNWIKQKNIQIQRRQKLSGLSQNTDSTDDENNIQRQLPKKRNTKLFQKQQKKQTKQKKYKTELCKNFSQNGICRYRKKCQFAHGMEQLNIQRKQKQHYRTKRCNSFWNEGACPYGQRCQFSHHQIHNSTTQLLISWKELLDCPLDPVKFSGSKILKLLNLL